MPVAVPLSDPDAHEDMLEFFLSSTQEWVPMDRIDPNPFRDIDNYPLDPVRMDALEASMRDTGVWPVFLGRRCLDNPSHVELAFAHHRWAVAKRMGLPGLNIAIVDLPDHRMIQIMGNENSEHWGNNVAHNNLTTKQARNYLDRLLDQFNTYDDFLANEFIGENWFTDPEKFYRSKREGVGVDVITSFLGDAWKKQTVANSILQIGRSSKRIAADNEIARFEKERIDAERREREDRLAKQRAESKHAAEARRQAQDEAKAAAEAKRLAEADVKRAKAEAQEAERKAKAAAKDAERADKDAARAEKDAARAERDQMAAELKEAQQRTWEAEDVERKRTEQVERIQRELEDALAQEKAERAEEERARLDMEIVQREERDFIAQYGDQYDYRAGELLQNEYQARVFRQMVMSEKALAAGLTRDQHVPLVQEILRSFTPSRSSMSIRQRPPIEDRLTSDNIANFINDRIEEQLRQRDEDAADRVRQENRAVRVQKSLNDVVAALKRTATALAQASSEIRRFTNDEPGFHMRGFEVSEIRQGLVVFENELTRFRETSNLDETLTDDSIINATATVLSGEIQ